VQNDSGYTPLNYVFILHYFPEKVAEAARLLIAHGADVNLKSKDGITPLMMAVRNEDLGLAVIESLIKAGANIDVVSDAGVMALHYAAANNNTFFEYLAEKSTDINVINLDTRDTSLHIAARSNQKKTVDYLLSKGAKVNEKNISGKTALNYAQEGGFSDIGVSLEATGGVATSEEEIAKIAAQQAELAALEKAKKDAEITSLKKAIKAKNVSEVQRFYKLESSEAEFDMHAVALQVLFQGDLEIFKFFVEQGLDIKMTDDGYSMLHDAIFHNKPDIARYLIEQGLDVNAESPDCRSVYVMSANSSIEALQVLLDAGITIDKEKHVDIVNEAVRYQNPVMAKYFIGEGYTFDPAVFEDEEILLKLVQRQDAATLQFLLDKGLDVETKVSVYGDDVTLLHLAVIIESTSMVDFLLKVGANPNAKNSSDTPIFKDLINSDELEIIKMFYENGADLNDTLAPYAKTPLHLALDLQRLDIARYLVNKGANVDSVEGFDKNSALHVAAKKGYLDVVKAMVEKGADVHLLNEARKAPLDVAIEYSQSAVRDYLTEIEAERPATR